MLSSSLVIVSVLLIIETNQVLSSQRYLKIQYMGNEDKLVLIKLNACSILNETFPPVFAD